MPAFSKPGGIAPANILPFPLILALLFFVLQGKYAEAQPLFERSQAIREKILGPEHPDVAESLFTRVRLLGIQVRTVSACQDSCGVCTQM